MKGLTKREKQVVRLLCEGLSYREVASILQISINTVYSHIRKIKFKFNARTQIQMIALVIKEENKDG